MDAATARKGRPTKKSVKKKPESPAPIVAIGASAGGGAAITELLSNFPADTGLAVVYIQHLDSQFPNPVPDALKKWTSLPVLEAQNDQAIEPNVVYVAPPASEVLLDKGRFKISRYPPKTPKGPGFVPGHVHGMPVDSFFRSLAAERKGAAMGVVLSGTASDGTLGMKAIKSEGGITFAQEPRTAKFDGMPGSAIATGAVDFVLAPRDIAREIANIARHPYLAKATITEPEDEVETGQDTGDDEAIQPILDLLRTRLGVDFGLYKRPTIQRRIARRMAMGQFHDFAAYHKRLEQKPEELDALYNDLLISVTSFFRDPEVFDSLKHVVFPRIMKSRPQGSPIRIWVPGCSTGEEVYSIAMCLVEFLHDAASDTPIQIFGTDLNEAVISQARAGIYAAAGVTQEVSAERIRQFFVPGERGYQVTSKIRDMCVFARQNITRDPPFSKLDLISCRNVLIYLGPALQKKAMTVFHYALKPSGFLLLGSSETVSQYSNLFLPTDRRQRLFSRKPTALRPNLDFSMPLSSTEKQDEPHHTEEPWTTLAEVQKEAERLILAHFAPAGVLIVEDGTILQFRGHTGQYLEPAPGEASLNITRMAREGLLADLRTALHEAVKTSAISRREGLRVKSNGDYRDVNIQVLPLAFMHAGQRCFVVLFEDVTGQKHADGQSAGAIKNAKRATRKSPDERSQVGAIRQELASTKLYLQSIIEEQEATNEELKSANEEIQSSNEELQSTNEELETAKEELQSTNEELSTVNEELHNRNIELTQLNNDLSNLLSSVSIPIVMLDRGLRIRRFTPMAEKMLNLIPADIGRPMTDIKPNVDIPNLDQIMANVLETLTIQQMEVRDRAGRWFSMWVRPYKTSDNKIDGIVIALSDIDALKLASERERAAREFADATIDTVQDGLVVLDSAMHVISANRAFYQAFLLTKHDIEGRSLFEVEGGEWKIPGLRELLEQTRDDDTKNQNYEVEHSFNKLGIRRLILNARRIEDLNQTHMILLGIADVTDRREEVETRYRQLFEAAKDSILVVDAASGRIIDVNPYTLEWLGYTRNELLGRQVWTLEMFSKTKEAEFMYQQVLEKGDLRYDGVQLSTSSHERLEAELIVNAYPVGTPKVVQFNLRDATERKKAEEQVRAALRDKEVLVQEIHHRVKNNLQVISSILSLQTKYIADETLAAALNETRNRVRAIATIHEMLYQTRGFARIEIAPYVRKLAATLLDFYGVAENQIRVDISISPVWFGIDKAIPCGLIVNELVSNVLKHAFPDGARDRSIEIALEPDADKHYVLRVRDNGRGFPKAFEPRKSQSLGLQMVYLLADQLNGTVEIGSRLGAEVIVRFPVGRVAG